MLRLPTTVFGLFLLGIAGCSDDAQRPPRLEAYHLQTAWTAAEPTTTKPTGGGRIIACEPPAPYCPGVDERPKRAYYYVFTEPPGVTSADFALDSTELGTDPAGGASVLLTLTHEGEARFRDLTRRIAIASRDQSEPHQLAFVLGDRLLTAPTIDYEHNPDGISGGAMELVGLPRDEAERIVKELRGD
jgi:preprotein translocase subunit SecD